MGKEIIMFAPKTLLLVDDNQRFLTVLADELRDRSDDFCILTAGNGDMALKVLESAHVDLVITDLKMPVMDGFELLSHMKKRYHNIPVIVISSFLHPDLETKLGALGVSQCIAKESLNVSALEEMILTLSPSPPGRGVG